MNLSRDGLSIYRNTKSTDTMNVVSDFYHRVSGMVNEAGRTEDVGDWPEKVEQFVLGLREGSIFCRSDWSATRVQQVRC